MTKRNRKHYETDFMYKVKIDKSQRGSTVSFIFRIVFATLFVIHTLVIIPRWKESFLIIRTDSVIFLYDDSTQCFFGITETRRSNTNVDFGLKITWNNLQMYTFDRETCRIEYWFLTKSVSFFLSWYWHIRSVTHSLSEILLTTDRAL